MRHAGSIPSLTMSALVVVMGLAGGCVPEDGAPIRARAVLGEVGRQPGQFAYPRALAADPAHGLLYVLDKSARIQAIDPTTGDARSVQTTPRFDRGKPTGLTVAAHPFRPGEPALYIADTHEHRVLVYALTEGGPSPEPEIEFGSFGRDPGQFVYPTDVAVLHDEGGRATRIYVGEYGGNDRVTAFDVSESGEITPAFSFGAQGPPADDTITFNRPQSISVDHERNELVVVDACHHRVGRFGLDGRLIAWLAGPAELDFPYGLALLGDGLAMVSEFGASRLSLLDLDTGEVLRRIGAPGRGAGELATPWGVEVAGDTAYALDSGNNRVLVFDAPAGASDAVGGWRR